VPHPDQLSLAQFSELVREYQAGLRAFIRALGVETDWVDDMAQEVFVVAYRRRGRFENDKDFGKWLRGIARNLVANERRKGARRARILNGPLTDFLVETAKSAGTTIESDAQRLVQAMNECIAQLPERSRALLQKRYESNENATALASLFNTSPEAIRQSLMRIRVWIKQCVECKGAWR
jgi:RNA polymerase sigma-70 factor (ECF subfamily)